MITRINVYVLNVSVAHWRTMQAVRPNQHIALRNVADPERRSSRIRNANKKHGAVANHHNINKQPNNMIQCVEYPKIYYNY